MGIQQTGVPLTQTRSLGEVSELVDSRAPPRAPERQRGLWSFLTWSFVIAPFVTAEAFFAKNASALSNSSDDQSNYGGVLDKDPAHATADNDPSSLASVVPDNSQEDDSDASRLTGVALPVLHGGNPSHGSVSQWAVRDADAGNSPAAGAGGGGGGGDTSGSNDATGSANFQNADALADAEQYGLTGQSQSSAEIPHGSPIGVAVDASTIGGLVDLSVGDGSVLASATTEGISTDTTAVLKILSPLDAITAASTAASEILSPVGVDTGLNLNHVLGFDLQVNGAGGFTATDLDAAALGMKFIQPAADLISTAVSVTADSESLLDFGASKTAAGLFGANDVLHAEHLDAVMALSGSAQPTYGDPTNDYSSTLEKLTDIAFTISPESGAGAGAPVVDGLDVARAGVVTSEAIDVTSAHSIDFPSQPLPVSDLLFRGSSYTDYNVALNTTVSSSAVSSIAATANPATNTHEPTVVSPVDSPNIGHDSGPLSQEHQNMSLTQISNAVDELSVRGHSH
jgi:hypothetical protein